MSDSLAEATQVLREKFSGEEFEGVVAFDIEDVGVIRASDGDVQTITDAENCEADVTISASLDTFREIFEGELSATAAYMTGRMKIDGDMSTAMKLNQILG